MYYVLTIIILVLIVICLCLYKALINTKATLDEVKDKYLSAFNYAHKHTIDRNIVGEEFDIVKGYITAPRDTFEHFRWFAKQNYVAGFLYEAFIRDEVSKEYEKLDRDNLYEYPSNPIEISKSLRVEVLRVRKKKGGVNYD